MFLASAASSFFVHFLPVPSLHIFLVDYLQGSTSVSGQMQKKQVKDELAGFIRVYWDGTVERFLDMVEDAPAEPRSNSASQHCVLSRDVMIDTNTRVWARIYNSENPNATTEKVPLMIYFHGGGFVLGSPAWNIYHHFLKRLSLHSGCVVVSVGYRRAPEHRLPVQYHDGLAALRWIVREAGKEPLRKADLHKIFLAGDSAGANIAHNVMVMASVAGNLLRSSSMNPVKILGLVSIQPLFGGLQGSQWEKMTYDPGLPRSWVDFFWRMALPEGADRGHSACDPLPMLRAMTVPPVSAALVCVGEKDVLRERNKEYCACLRGVGVDVQCVVFRDVGHAFLVFEPGSSAIDCLLNVVRDFIRLRCCNSAASSSSSSARK